MPRSHGTPIPDPQTWLHGTAVFIQILGGFIHITCCYNFILPRCRGGSRFLVWGRAFSKVSEKKKERKQSKAEVLPQAGSCSGCAFAGQKLQNWEYCQVLYQRKQPAQQLEMGSCQLCVPLHLSSFFSPFLLSSPIHLLQQPCKLHLHRPQVDFLGPQGVVPWILSS